MSKELIIPNEEMQARYRRYCVVDEKIGRRYFNKERMLQQIIEALREAARLAEMRERIRKLMCEYEDCRLHRMKDRCHIPYEAHKKFKGIGKNGKREHK